MVDLLTCLLSKLHAVKMQQLSQTLNNGLVQNWERNTTKRLYAVTLLFNLCAEYIMQNAGLDEPQGRIKTAGRNINNLRYADDNSLMAESEEGLKSLLLRVKEENEKAALKFNIRKTKTMASGPITT